MKLNDQALGAAIRRRRRAIGLPQREAAEAADLTALVWGRIELGTRTCRATELWAIASALGTTTDELLRGSTPIPPEEVVERAVVHREGAVKMMQDYGSAIVDAIAAVTESANGAHVDGVDLVDADDVTAFLCRTPSYVGVTVPADLVAVVRAALDHIAAATPVYGRGGDDDG